MHEVQTFSRLGVPFTLARTFWMLGSKRRLVRTWECEIVCPKPGPLPQTSQLAATETPYSQGSPVGDQVCCPLGNCINLAEDRPATQIGSALGPLESRLQQCLADPKPVVEVEVRSRAMGF